MFKNKGCLYLDNVGYRHNINSPLDQFEIRDLLSLDAPILGNLHLAITNIGLYLMLGAFFILTLSLLSTNYNALQSYISIRGGVQLVGSFSRALLAFRRVDTQDLVRLWRAGAGEVLPERYFDG